MRAVAFVVVLAACGPGITRAPAPEPTPPTPTPATAAAVPWTPARAPGAAAPGPLPASPPGPGLANLAPGDDRVVGPPGPLPECLARLASAGVRTRPSTLPVHREGKSTCGAPEVVTYLAGPTGVKWSSPPLVTCTVALGLARLEVIVAEEAARHLGSAPKRIEHLGTYSCRKMVRFDLASEHSFANAIDVRGVVLADGRKVTVEADWGPVGGEPRTAGGRFLRAVARRAYDENVFSVVLGPPWDALHRDHLHLDQARYRVDGLIVR